MKKILPLETALLIMLLIFISQLSHAQEIPQESPRFLEGDRTAGIILSANSIGDEEALTVGGAFNYFVTDLTAPGFKALISTGDYYMGETYVSADQYIFNTGSYLPFAFVDLGYFYTNVEINEKSPVQGLILRGGPGMTVFITNTIGLRVKGFYQTYLKDFSEKIDELTGWGFNLGLSVFMR